MEFWLVFGRTLSRLLKLPKSPLSSGKPSRLFSIPALKRKLLLLLPETIHLFSLLYALQPYFYNRSSRHFRHLNLSYMLESKSVAQVRVSSIIKRIP